MTLEQVQALFAGTLPDMLGIRFVALGDRSVAAELEVRPAFLAPNGRLHATAVVALADTACGVGTMAHLPPGAVGFATVELVSHFLATAREGVIACEATLAHGGRTTQVWDARVTGGDRTLAMFRCTQLLLYPKDGGGG